MTSVLGLLRYSTISAHSFRSGSGQGRWRDWHTHIRQMLFFHGQGRLVEVVHIQVLEHIGSRHVAEQGDLFPDLPGERVLGHRHTITSGQMPMPCRSLTLA